MKAINIQKFKEFLKKYKWILVTIAAVLVIIIFGQILLNKTGITSTSLQFTTATVSRGNITSSISASGTIQTSNYLAVTTSVNGIVNKVLVKEGDSVYKGQALMNVTLDSEGETNLANAYSSYLRAKNSLASAQESLTTTNESAILSNQISFNSAQDKMNDGKTSMMNFKIAENNLQKAKQDLEIQKTNILSLQIALNSAWNQYQAQSQVIVAPASGTIANIVAVEGAQISNTISTTSRSTQTVASIKQQGTPIASVNISELDINSVKPGQKANISLNSINNQQFVGTVVGIDKIGTSSGGVANYPVSIKFDADSDKVLPNMGLNTDIIIVEHQGVLYVPSAALSSKNGKKTVTVVNGTSSSTVEVTTGISDGTNTEILTGLNEGEIVEISALPTSGFTNQTTTQNRGFGGGAGVFLGR
jgi:multidrug efflux pump subunit AcrA (membrane-fusion protein)